VIYSSDEEEAGESNSQAEVSGEDSSDKSESELESEPESESEVENNSGEDIGPMGDEAQEKKRKSEPEQQQKKKQRREQEKLSYEVGEFVTAMYENQWLVAQVDINQDKAGDKHVNLSYMERIGENQFRWPRHHDLLLTLKEDILTKCSVPCLVGNSIRALHVGLSAADALAADVALAAVAYLQLILFQMVFLNFFIFPFLFVPLLRQRGIHRVWL
jgi:hypothetical protein